MKSLPLNKILKLRALRDAKKMKAQNDLAIAHERLDVAKLEVRNKENEIGNFKKKCALELTSEYEAILKEEVIKVERISQINSLASVHARMLQRFEFQKDLSINRLKAADENHKEKASIFRKMSARAKLIDVTAQDLQASIKFYYNLHREEIDIEEHSNSTKSSNSAKFDTSRKK